jgi:hypothetical protein
MLPTDPTETANPQDPSIVLPRHTYWVVVDTLRTRMPDPPTDAPEYLARRDQAAIAHVASLLPGNADEAHIAARYVAASAWADDCLSLARQCRATDPANFLKCLAQANRTLREARGMRSLLQRLQAERRKREADPAATDRAAWTEHCAIGLMADALAEAPPPAPAAAPPDPPPAPAAPDEPDEPVRDPLAEAEQYALIYPRRAALIRKLGRLPDNPSFGPPDDWLVQALVRGQSRVLRELDEANAVTG